MKSYQLMIARFGNGTTCRSTAEVINAIQDANGSNCTISPLLTVRRDPKNGYYVAADVGARSTPTYTRVSDYYSSVSHAGQALQSIGQQDAAAVLDKYNLW